jgi:hypothetical protein
MLLHMIMAWSTAPRSFFTTAMRSMISPRNSLMNGRARVSAEALLPLVRLKLLPMLDAALQSFRQFMYTSMAAA